MQFLVQALKIADLLPKMYVLKYEKMASPIVKI